ncbi:elongation factor Ts, mitochondrial-like, partial [Phasianus colchicus]|uniref:elongation factor Ts, mitochondrial-like n=1 Tax=Phasianus colchicus TaxID=9054 RepID=UPI00129DBE18
ARGCGNFRLPRKEGSPPLFPSCVFPPVCCCPPPNFVPPQAEVWLLARAQEEGWRRAERLRERRAKEGLLGALQSGHCAVLVEVNCETDFVARNAAFQRLVCDAAMAAMGHCHSTAPPASCTKRFLSAAELSQLRMEPGGALLSERLALTIGEKACCVSPPVSPLCPPCVPAAPRPSHPKLQQCQLCPLWHWALAVSPLCL